MKQLFPVFTVLLLLAAPLNVFANNAESDAQEQRRDTIYHFQHRLLPYWVFNDGDAFFAMLQDSNIANKAMPSVAARIVDKAFADQLKVKVIEPGKAVLISFEPPAGSLLCFHAIVAKTDKGYVYYTLEKAEDITGDGKTKTMYCAWVETRNRENYGPRDYEDEAAFVKEFTATASPKAAMSLSLEGKDGPVLTIGNE